MKLSTLSTAVLALVVLAAPAFAQSGPPALELMAEDVARTGRTFDAEVRLSGIAPTASVGLGLVATGGPSSLLSQPGSLFWLQQPVILDLDIAANATASGSLFMSFEVPPMAELVGMQVVMQAYAVQGSQMILSNMLSGGPVIQEIIHY